MANVPPGVVHNVPLVEVASGGHDKEWNAYTKTKQYTNAFIKQDGKILLGYKKRGIGQGLFNGFGGKVEPGETPLQAAVRELQEEAGVDAPLRPCGKLFFHVPSIETAFDIHLFTAETYAGTIIETDEMRPQWFSTSAAPSSQTANEAPLQPIPYNQMWADDIYWLPLLLADQKFAGRADFADENVMTRYWFGKEVA